MVEMKYFGKTSLLDQS